MSGACRHVALHQAADHRWLYALLDPAGQLLVGRLDKRFFADRCDGDAAHTSIYPWIKAVTARLVLPHEVGLTFVVVSEAIDEHLMPVRVITGPVVMAEQAWDYGDYHELTRCEVLDHLNLPDADLDGAAGRTTVVHAIRKLTGVRLPDDDFDAAWVLALLVTYIEGVIGESLPAARPSPTLVASATSREGAPGQPVPREQLLTREMLHEIVPVSDMTLWRWTRSGRFPQPLKFNGRTYWRAGEVQAWIDARSKERRAG